jgi:hypothetical protein
MVTIYRGLQTRMYVKVGTKCQGLNVSYGPQNQGLSPNYPAQQKVTTLFSQCNAQENILFIPFRLSCKIILFHMMHRYNKCGKENDIYYMTNLIADEGTNNYSLFLFLATWSVIQRLRVNRSVAGSCPHCPFRLYLSLTQHTTGLVM